VVFGSFFSSKKDPQRNIKIATCFDYLKFWYESIHASNIHAVLFYDNLDDDFVTKYTTNLFSFHKVSKEELNDNLFPAEWRFIAYYNYLKSHTHKYDYIVLTDISDVIINRNPLEFMIQYPEKDIFFSYELAGNLEWVDNYWADCLIGDNFPREKRIFNAGMWAGKTEAVLTHLYLLRENLLSLASRTMSPGTCDMLFQIKIANEYWGGNDLTRERMWGEGQPLYNKIKTEEGEPGEPPEVLITYYIVHAHRTVNCNGNSDNGWFKNPQ